MRIRSGGILLLVYCGVSSGCSGEDDTGSAGPAVDAATDGSGDGSPGDAAFEGDQHSVTKPLPDCGVVQSSALTSLPKYSGTLPPAANMTTAGGSSYLYVLTQWGFARASLANPENPAPYSQIIIGHEGGTPSSAVFDILCDCHQGSNTMDVAEAPGGTSARLISDWQPYAQGGDPASAKFSGLPAQLVQAAANLSFGQQVALPTSVPLGGQVAAIQTSSQKYFGYFPTSNGIQLVDLTSPTGSSNPTSALQPTQVIDWASGLTPGKGARLRASQVSIPGYEKALLVGAIASDSMLRVAEIDPNTGLVSEIASAPLASTSVSLDVAAVDNRLFIFSAEFSSGLQVYELQPPSTLAPAGSIPGKVRYTAVRGPAPFPVLLLLRDEGGPSFVDLYDTTWLTQGGSPVLVKSLPHLSAADAAYRGHGFEALVTGSGTTLTAYLYREVGPPPPGLPVVEAQIHTDVIDLSCLGAP